MKTRQHEKSQNVRKHQKTSTRVARLQSEQKGRERKNKGWAEWATDEDEDNPHCEASKNHITVFNKLDKFIQIQLDDFSNLFL